MAFPTNKLNLDLVVQSGGLGLKNLVATSNSDLSSAASQQYVLNQIALVDTDNRIDLAATSALAAVTYANGASGVGATLTFNATGTNTVDGVVTSLGQRIGVFAQAAGLQNGIYEVTTAGAVGVAGIWTRVAEFDTSAEMISGYDVVTKIGTDNNSKHFTFQTSSAITVGTTAINFKCTGGYLSANAALAINAAGLMTVTPSATGAVEVAIDGLAVRTTDGVKIVANNVVADLDAAGAIVLNGTSLAVATGDGLMIDTNAVAVNFASQGDTEAKASSVLVVNPADLLTFNRNYDAGVVSIATFPSTVKIAQATHGLVSMSGSAALFQVSAVDATTGAYYEPGLDFAVTIVQADGGGNLIGDVLLSAGVGFDAVVSLIGR